MLMCSPCLDGLFFFKRDVNFLHRLVRDCEYTQKQHHEPAFQFTYFFNCFFVAVKLSQPPQYIDERLALYTKLKAEHDALMAERAAKNSRAIKVTLPDGKVVEAESWKTTPYQVACGIRSVW